MLKHLVSLMVLGIVLYMLYGEFLETPFVNTGELSTVREKAVHLANQGEFNKSLELFKSLLEVAPNNREIWGDYLLVLARANQKDKAIRKAKSKRLDLIPSYAFKELFDIAIYNNDWAFAQQLVQSEILVSKNPIEVAIHRSTTITNHGHLELATEILVFTKYIYPNSNGALDTAMIQSMLRTDPSRAHLEAKKLLTDDAENRDELWRLINDYWVQQARQGNIKPAIEALEFKINQAPTTVKFDYFVLLTWDGMLRLHIRSTLHTCL